MISKADAEYLSRRREILDEVEKVRAELATKIRALVKAGESPTELAKLSGLSRERIYQIRDGRRK